MNKKDLLKIFQVTLAVVLLIFAYALYVDYNQTIKHIKYFITGDKAVYRTFLNDYYDVLKQKTYKYCEIANKQRLKLNEMAEFNNMLKTNLSELLPQENLLLEKYKNNIYNTICSYKQFTPNFANEVAGWWTADEARVKECFSQIIFSEAVINQIVSTNYENFKSEVDMECQKISDKIVSQTKASQYKYLSEIELKAMTEVTFKQYNFNFDSTSFKINMLPAFAIGSFAVGCVIADRLIPAIISRVGTALAARGVGATACVGSGWLTFGVTIAAGYLADKYFQSKFAESLIPEINDDIEKVAIDVSENFKNTISSQINIGICQK